MNVNGERVEEESYLYGENQDEGACYSGTKRTASPEPSCVSVKNDHSKSTFSDGVKWPRLENQPTASLVPSCVSMKSNHSSLSGCLVTMKGCASLASALSSNSTLLRQLDLSYNHPEKMGMELLSAKVDDPNYELKKLNLNHGGVFKLKPGVRKYACELTMDVNTVNSALVLSEDHRKVTYVCPKTQLQFDPNHPERSQYTQLLCKESLSGRCYWEAEWSGWKAGIAVAYKGTTREFGRDENSWCLFAFKNKFFLRHKDKKKVIPGPYSNRVGVYLDWPTGMLSFYSVQSDGSTLSHLHTVQCRFTKPVYAGFYVYEASMSLCHLYGNL